MTKQKQSLKKLCILRFVGSGLNGRSPGGFAFGESYGVHVG